VKPSELYRYLRMVSGIAGAARKMATVYGRTRWTKDPDEDPADELDNLYLN
jgi:hypothetical protein